MTVLRVGWEGCEQTHKKMRSGDDGVWVGGEENMHVDTHTHTHTPVWVMQWFDYHSSVSM